MTAAALAWAGVTGPPPSPLVLALASCESSCQAATPCRGSRGPLGLAATNWRWEPPRHARPQPRWRSAGRGVALGGQRWGHRPAVDGEQAVHRAAPAEPARVLDRPLG